MGLERRRGRAVRDSPGVSGLTKVEGIFRNPALYTLAQSIPKASTLRGGRPRTYPNYMLLGYEALVSVYGSARQVEAELAHPMVWSLIRRLASERFPDSPELRLPEEPMRRHHYIYGRNRYLTRPDILQALGEIHRQTAAAQARQLGLLDPGGPGSWTKPHPSRLLYADGKVLTPLFKAKPGQTTVDRGTGEVRQTRAELDADLHFEGDGEAAWGVKFVLVAARTNDERGRIILDVEWVPRPGAEAAVAMDCFLRIAPLVPGTQAVVYDTALRGMHHQVLLRDLGLIPINRVTAAEAGASTPRRRDGRRVEKSVHIEDRVVTLPDGSSRTMRFYARGGAVGIGDLTDRGDLVFVELRRIRTHRTRDKNGQYRWYNDYALPAAFGGRTVTMRLHANEEDHIRRFNRTENVRPIPPSDPEFRRLYARRNDAESINRGVVDSLYLGRAHSLGHARQQLNLLGYALMVNSLALLAAGHTAPPEPLAA
jgi:hypothetical protein